MFGVIRAINLERSPLCQLRATFHIRGPQFQQIFLGQPTQLQQNRQSRFSPSNNYGRISYVGHSVANSRIRKTSKSSGLDFTLFLAPSQNWEKATIIFVISASSSVHMQQLGSNWMDFQEISYLNKLNSKNCRDNSSFILKKSKSNKGHFTRRLIYIFGHNSLNSS